MMMYISKMIQSFIQLENNRKKSKLENKSYDYQAYDVFISEGYHKKITLELNYYWCLITEKPLLCRPSLDHLVQSTIKEL